MAHLKVTAPDKTVSILGIDMKQSYERLNAKIKKDLPKYKIEVIDDEPKASKPKAEAKEAEPKAEKK